MKFRGWFSQWPFQDPKFYWSYQSHIFLAYFLGLISGNIPTIHMANPTFGSIPTGFMGNRENPWEIIYFHRKCFPQTLGAVNQDLYNLYMK